MAGELDGKFRVTMPLAKVWEDEDGELWFEGVASSTTLDRQQERMTPNAISKMATYKGIELLPSHSAGPLEELGSVEEAWADNDQFRVAGRLDKSNPQAKRLFQRAMSGRSFGLSVGGRVTKAYWQHDPEAGRQVRHIDDVELDHVAVCRPEAAANPDTYLAALAKASEGVIGEAEDEEAMLARIGRAAVNAAKSLWPFAKAEEAPAEEALPTDEQGELRELREEVAGLRKAIEGLRRVPEREEAPVARGESKALPGQERSASGDPWAGVV